MWDMETKVANSGATDAGKHKASEYNNRQAELQKAVTHAGITLTTKPADPDATPDSNTEMLAEAMSRVASKAVYGTDGGSANTYVVSKVSGLVAPKALFDGMKVHFVPGNANTGASTLNAFGLGVKKLRTFDDTDLNGGELSAEAPCEAIYDSTADSATGAWLLLPWTDLWIKSDMTITVGASGADYTTVQAALDSLKYKLIARDATVTISLAAEDFTISAPIRVEHPMAHRIQIVGANLAGANPGPGDFGGTKATDETMLRGRFDTVIECSSTVDALQIVDCKLGMLKNILFIGNGGANGVTVGRTLIETTTEPTPALGYGSGGVTIQDCWAHDFEYGFRSRQTSQMECKDCGASHNTAGGFAINNTSHMTGWQIRAYYNDHGITLVDNAHAEIYGVSSTRNTSINIALHKGSSIVVVGIGATYKYASNGAKGVQALWGSSALIQDVDFSTTTTSSEAFDGSHVHLLSCDNVGTLSPAANTNGNRNSMNGVS